ncbi:MAG: uncharacterized SAM-binding protein YcdF (DUF218 family) [Oleiphilaceae bacterium]|jgi:uncharacterized SAM-binding protein YcdF (DUF218 family)
MDALFLVKKLLSALLMPLPLGFIMLILAVCIFYLGYRRLAKCLGIGIIFTWFTLSLSPISALIAAPLEYAFPKYNQQTVKYVVVLGGYHNSDERIPISSLLSKVSLMRLSEGMRIYRLNPSAKLLLSGYKSKDVISNAEAMEKVAHVFGIPKHDIVMAKQPKDTAEEAAHWAKYLNKNMLKGQHFALVTSAMHIPRAMYLFQNQGLQPIAAPTEFRTGGHHSLNWQDWFPNASSLTLVESAWHEYLGKLWATIRS